MKIDFVTDTFLPDVNGVAMTLARLTDGLRRRGHRIHVIRTGERGSGETVVPSVGLPGYKEVRLGLPGPFRLRKRWSKRRPDAIYVATESLLGDSAVKVGKSMGIPVITGFHTNFHEYMTQYRLGSFEPAARYYLKRFHSRADCTLAPSQEVVEMLRAQGFPEVHLLGRGVDTALFDPAKRCEALRASWGAGPSVPVALVVGRVAAEKNLDLAMQAFHRLVVQQPELRCVVVGDGPLREKLSQEHPQVHFSGVKTGEELARHYASADFLLFPSETETFGNVLLEGMASGLVAVSYDYAAAARHVTHAENAYKAAKGDADEFVALAGEAMRVHRDDLMRIRARETAEALGWDSIIGSFEEHLRGLTNGGSIDLKRKVPAKRPKLECRTVFLSDIHLGTPDSKASEAVNFLKHLRCEKLVLNGDIIDGWALRRGGRWRNQHSRFIRKVLKMVEKEKTEVIYLRGNHDDILERFLPLAFGRVQMAKEHIHTSLNGKRYLVVHGDGFDSVSTNHRWLAVLGSIGYDVLLKVNRIYNRWRTWRGREYYSLSKKIKAKVKGAVSFVDRYEQQLQELARYKRCDGILCGHIHTPEDKRVGDIHYLNSGDWVESLTAVIEHLDGRMELVQYSDFLEKLYGGVVVPVTETTGARWENPLEKKTAVPSKAR
jgi:UDP-2,3-diacylglucosamine pyrophosphatase LpxH/glycosyltransferase involved in cell wall biosynthesis